MYRLYYGGGQISRTFQTFKEAEREKNTCMEWSRMYQPSAPIPRIQKLVDDGIWITCKAP